MKDKKSCIICLIDICRPKKHDSPCECKPYLHQRCVNMWYKNFPNECPICRINYEDIGENDIIIRENNQDRRLYNNRLRVNNIILFFTFISMCYYGMITFL